jgi:hypothetical protein
MVVEKIEKKFRKFDSVNEVFVSEPTFVGYIVNGLVVVFFYRFFLFSSFDAGGRT